MNPAVCRPQSQRWLKPSEVTEPGVYWVADSYDCPEQVVPYVRTIDVDNDGGLYERRYGEVLSAYPELRYYGPIQPPEYKGEKN